MKLLTLSFIFAVVLCSTGIASADIKGDMASGIPLDEVLTHYVADNPTAPVIEATIKEMVESGANPEALVKLAINAGYLPESVVIGALQGGANVKAVVGAALSTGKVTDSQVTSAAAFAGADPAQVSEAVAASAAAGQAAGDTAPDVPAQETSPVPPGGMEGGGAEVSPGQ